MLSSRRQQILSALIEEYVAHACPVGSRTIAENHKLGVSPATIRNELSALEEAGYITQPHTSAGRIPTDAGYREFVDELLSQNASQNKLGKHAQAIEALKSSADALDNLIERTNEELARLTQCLSLIMAPKPQSCCVRQISLVSLSEYSTLVVLVSDGGNVANETVIHKQPMSLDRLAALESLLNKHCVHKQVDDIPAVLSKDASLHDADSLVIVQGLLNAAATFDRTQTCRSGMSTLLRKPEFSSAESILPVMEILEDESVLFKAISEDNVENNAIQIRIGHENTSKQLSGVSVIAAVYECSDAQGIVAVIGPTRMDYTNTINAVRAAQNVLNGE